jgi:trk system potassium uptake protein TrkA
LKQFLIIGLGNFGMGVAKTLYEDGNDTTVVDKDKARVQMIQKKSNQAILGDATDRKILEQLGADKFDAAVISTGVDQHAVILITLHLKELGCQRIIAKAENPDHGKILLAVGAYKVIYPEEEMAKKVAHSLSNPNFLDYIPLGAEYTVAEIAPPTKFHGKSLVDLSLRQEYKIEVIAVKDVVSGIIRFIPSPDYIFKDSDIMVCVGKLEDLEKIREN